MKGIYFPNGNFLAAKKGSKPSWGWASILEGRDLLKDDLYWKTGNGRNIRIFMDKWIPTGEGFKLKERALNEEMEKMMVEELIKEGDWNFEMMRDMLDDEDKELIRRVKLTDTQADDKPVWRRSRDGTYVVKLGYKAAWEKERRMERNVASSSYSPSKKMWNKMWNIRICPKVKNFLWRAVKGALATNEALHKRKCSKSPACRICKTKIESVEHLLFLCPWAAQCWYNSPLALRFEEESMIRMDKWLEEWMAKEEGPDEYALAMYASMCWAIWKARCKYIFENVEIDTVKCISSAIRMVRDYWSVLEKKVMKRGRSKPRERKMRWEKPEWGKYKINIDAAFNQKSKEAAVGIIGRDWEGRFTGGISRRVDADTAFQAECQALMEAVEGGDLWGKE